MWCLLLVICRCLLLLLAMLAMPAFSQSDAPILDPRVDPAVIRHLNLHERAPVIVVVGGRLSEVREFWRLLGRELRFGHGELVGLPNNQGEFFAELTRSGVFLVLSSDQVEEIYLTFEATLPDDD